MTVAPVWVLSVILETGVAVCPAVSVKPRFIRPFD
jgi:hypothetical protein